MATATTLHPKLSELAPNREDLYRVLGYPGEVPAEMYDFGQQLWAEAPNHFEIQCGYLPVPAQLGMRSFSVGEHEFNCGRIIAVGLKGSEQLVLMLATLGHPAEQWRQRLFDSGDVLAGYMADVIASICADSIIDWLGGHIRGGYMPAGWNCTNNYSPGYCDWPTEEQQQVFKLFPPKFCGVELTESSLMLPIKSVTAVMGLGPTVRRLGYACNVCTMKECVYRNIRLKNEKQKRAQAALQA